MASEQIVGLNPDGTGKDVRVLEITTLLPTGQTATVEMQVVSIADQSGQLISFGIDQQVLIDILNEMRKQTLILSQLKSSGGLSGISGEIL